MRISPRLSTTPHDSTRCLSRFARSRHPKPVSRGRVSGLVASRRSLEAQNTPCSPHPVGSVGRRLLPRFVIEPTSGPMVTASENAGSSPRCHRFFFFFSRKVVDSIRKRAIAHRLKKSLPHGQTVWAGVEKFASTKRKRKRKRKLHKRFFDGFAVTSERPAPLPCTTPRPSPPSGLDAPRADPCLRAPKPPPPPIAFDLAPRRTTPLPLRSFHETADHDAPTRRRRHRARDVRLDGVRERAPARLRRVGRRYRR